MADFVRNLNSYKLLHVFKARDSVFKKKYKSNVLYFTFVSGGHLRQES